MLHGARAGEIGLGEGGRTRILLDDQGRHARLPEFNRQNQARRASADYQGWKV